MDKERMSHLDTAHVVTVSICGDLVPGISCLNVSTSIPSAMELCTVKNNCYFYVPVASFYTHEGIFPFTLRTNSISWESCQVAIHNWKSQWSQVRILYQNIEALYTCPRIGTFFMWNLISAGFIFTWPEQLYSFLCAIYLDLVSCLMEPTYKCYLSSRFHLKLISGIKAHKYIRKCCTWLRRLAASQRPLSKGGKTVMLKIY
jgi:hypothetical protein